MLTIKNLIEFTTIHFLKIGALLILIVALVSTWVFLKKDDLSTEEIHSAIREEFQSIVRTKLLEKNPLAKNIKFHELWTETSGDKSQIKAIFSYSFNDGASSDPSDIVDVTVSGFALMNKLDSKINNDEIQNWEIGSFTVDQTEMAFNNEVLIIRPEPKKENKPPKEEDTEQQQQIEFEVPEQIYKDQSLDLNQLEFDNNDSYPFEEDSSLEEQL